MPLGDVVWVCNLGRCSHSYLLQGEYNVACPPTPLPAGPAIQVYLAPGYPQRVLLCSSPCRSV